MCAEKMQRILMAIMLGVVIFLFNSGMTLIANIIGILMVVMILIWAVMNFCPSIWVFKKFFEPCNFNEDK